MPALERFGLKNEIMHDGKKYCRHRDLLISPIYYPIDRIDRDDGILELVAVQDRWEVRTLIPLDDHSAPSELIADDVDIRDEYEIEASLSFFSNQPFSRPRTLGDSNVPERIIYEDPRRDGITWIIDLYDDHPLPQRTEHADAGKPDPAAS
jgi:hypothetical protein